MRRRLLAWYRRSRRDLPWRHTKDPYRIWVSEVMLQQTQVATALPYYQSFLERFPTVRDLAAAREAEVLAAWSGLGYYRRARHLHVASRTVVRAHGGRVPREEAAFGSLPGVGRYTRGAVLSIAFDRPLPVLDGNVARVLARLCAVPGSIRGAASAEQPKGARARANPTDRLWEIASRLVPTRGAGDWNQALMELGATVCTPRAPRCGECPIASACLALARGAVDRYPAAAPRPATRVVRRAVVVLRRGGRWVLLRRSGALLDGLWEPPGVEIEARDGVPQRKGTSVRKIARHGKDAHEQTVRALLGRELERHGLATRIAPTPHRARHRITHRAIEVEVWDGSVPRVPRRAHVRAVDPNAPGIAITGLTRKLIRLLAPDR